MMYYCWRLAQYQMYLALGRAQPERVTLDHDVAQEAYSFGLIVTVWSRTLGHLPYKPVTIH